MLAVDAGVHLSSIARIIEPHLPEGRIPGQQCTLTSGPFAGLELPHISAKANAGHITRTIVDTYLITHPHLDHISGMVVNTAALPGTRVKRIAALPSTISAFKNHIFNNVIWPNLSDENDGAGLVTYMRLVEGGSPALGNADSKGYVEICEGLSVKTWSVSHGHCMENHWHRGSSVGLNASFDASPMRRSSNPMSLGGFGQASPRAPYSSHPSTQENVCVYDSSAYFIRDIKTGREVLIFGDVEPDAISLSPRNHQVWSEAAPKILSGILKTIFIECSYDDSRSDDTLFGHLAPRFLIGELIALARQVITFRSGKRSMASRASSPSASDIRKRKRMSQSSHNPATGNSPLGMEIDVQSPGSKQSPDTSFAREVIRKSHQRDESSVSPHTKALHHPPSLRPIQVEAFELDDRVHLRAASRDQRRSGASLSSELEPTSAPSVPLAVDLLDPVTEQSGDGARSPPGRSSPVGMLAGLKVVIIHVKDKLNDEEPAGETILREMMEYEAEEQLGCHFEIAHPGMSVFM